MSKSLTTRELIRWAANLLTESDSPELDAKVLFKFISGYTDVDLILKAQTQQSINIRVRYEELINQRRDGVPVAYLTGYKEFWSLSFDVTTDTLIPRPETELLVEVALALLPKYRFNKVIDLGCGTGAIGLAIAKERPKSEVLAVDSSAAALEVARANTNKFNLNNVEFMQSDWFNAITDKRFDLIVSNPPYIADLDPHLNQGDVRFEPINALKAGSSGLDDLAQIISQAPNFLNSKGWVVVEHGFDQAQQVRELFKRNNYQQIEHKTDLNNHPRVSLAQKP